ncbi:MAG: pyridoxal phosphate-dependent aminotransferase [Cytophagales bacterium]|nr:pyridoxal phosphate-dependent aminotransferase [Cytophagales bacterium]MDW8383366.1 pyridoxal phosphate-dependent aminotransferase [Flammeovirgaceae bacterium]
MAYLSDRINALAESATLGMAVKARELQEKGIHVIKLNVGEPDFPTPKHICEAAKQAIDSGKYFTYSPVPGYPDLIKGIIQKLKKDNQLEYSPKQIVVSTGAKQSLANVILCVVNPGDEVLIFSPYWVSYAEQVKLAGGIPIELKTDISTGFKVTPQQLQKAITPKTRLVMYSSPCNPTGAVFSEAELRAYAEVLKPYENILVLADEIYEYINFGRIPHFSMAQIPFMKERTIVVNGFSKGYAMTGWRVGYIAAPEYIATAANKLQGQYTSGTCSIAQRAAVAAITGDNSFAKEMNEAYRRRRDLVKSLLDQIKGVKTYTPDGAFYIFPDVSDFFGKSYNGQTIRNSPDLAMYLLNEGHVAVVDGESFGEPKCIRISFAASDEELKEACQRIKIALEKLS